MAERCHVVITSGMHHRNLPTRRPRVRGRHVVWDEHAQCPLGVTIVSLVRSGYRYECRGTQQLQGPKHGFLFHPIQQQIPKLQQCAPLSRIEGTSKVFSDMYNHTSTEFVKNAVTKKEKETIIRRLDSAQAHPWATAISLAKLTRGLRGTPTATENALEMQRAGKSFSRNTPV